ncbi:MAG: PilN domain-containing protein [Elusimicrobia bacterium]|nr:PilN domain-containing protein [Elusimicrobiota bacterium]
MFEINLIRDRAILPGDKKEVYGYYKIAALVAAVALGIIISIFFMLTSRIANIRKSKESTLAQIENTINKYNIEQWGKEWMEAYQHIKVIGNIFSERVMWAPRLKELAEILPKEMCIDSIEVSKDNTITLRIIALAKEQQGFERVKRYIDSLDKNVYFGTGVKMESQKRTRLKDQDVDLFTIVVPVKTAGNE